MTPLALGPVFGAGPVTTPTAAPPGSTQEAVESLDGASIVEQLPPDVIAVMIGAGVVSLLAWSLAMRFKLGRRPVTAKAHPKPVPPVALVALAEEIPLVRGLPDDFTTVALLEDVAEVFRAAHRGRGRQPCHPRLTDAAHEAVTASAPGFEEVVAVHLGPVRLIRAEGGVDGATAVVELRALIDEIRASEPHATEVCEQWRVVRRPDSAWRVQGVDRVWRRPLAPPRLPPEPEPRHIPPIPEAAAFALAQPELTTRATATVEAVLSALEAGDVLGLAGVVTALALEELATRVEVGRRAGVGWRCRPTKLRVDLVHVACQADTWLLTCHVSGSARCWLEDVDGATIAGDPDADRPLDERWTFRWRDEELVLVHPG